MSNTPKNTSVASQNLASQNLVSQSLISQNPPLQTRLPTPDAAPTLPPYREGQLYEGTVHDYLPYSCPRDYPQQYPDSDRVEAVRAYVKKTWQTLRRGHDHIVEAAKDSKVEHEAAKSWPVYISRKENPREIAETLKETMAEGFESIRLEVLPENRDEIEEHGLLYLPGDYVVPGGRFNELYGWDSYFILVGLLHDGELALAKSLTDQLLYQVEHYGSVLNANRTYFLGRSQPPLLARMVLRLYEHTQDEDWLRSTVPTLVKYYEYWLKAPHYDAESGLSTYYATGNGPAPEVVVSECDEFGRTHFDRIREFYKTETVDEYDVSLFYDAEKDELTDLFYKGDRSMRESGFDPTNRFGPFSVDIIHYLPVCLNVLLHQMEQDMAELYRLLNDAESIGLWNNRATARKESINAYLWDEEDGQYYDYHMSTAQRSRYEFATTFYPLWAGIASPEQAAAVVSNLSKFEAPGGVRTSNHFSGSQWDAPFGWAPLQLIAVEGLQRYGYTEDAQRLARRFISMVVQDFERTGSLLEKYDLEACSGKVSDEIHFGYSSNEVGFGWTNGVVLALLDLLDSAA